MKHIKLFENNIKRYWILNDPGESMYDDVTYLFGNEKDLSNFTANRVYNTIKEHYNEEHSSDDDKSMEEVFSELDKCTNAEDMLEVLYDAIDNGMMGEYDRRPRLEATSLDENVKLEDWIELRRTAKKYNL